MHFLWRVSCVAVVSLFLCQLGVSEDSPSAKKPGSKTPKAVLGELSREDKTQPNPALDAFMQEWYAANSKIDRLDIRFNYREYNSVFGYESAATGLASVDRAKRGFFQLIPQKVEPGTRGHRYPLQKLDAVRAHFTGDSFILVDEEYRTFERVVIPPEDRHPYSNRNRNLNLAHPDRPAAPHLPDDAKPVRIAPESVRNDEQEVDAPDSDSQPAQASKPPTILDAVLRIAGRFIISNALSQVEFDVSDNLLNPRYSLSQFLIIEKPEVLLAHFQISIIKESETDITLQFVPRYTDRFTGKVQMIVKRQTHLPWALKQFDTAGNFESVYVATEVKCNQSPTAPFGDLGPPDLTGYRRVSPPGPSSR